MSGSDTDPHVDESKRGVYRNADERTDAGQSATQGHPTRSSAPEHATRPLAQRLLYGLNRLWIRANESQGAFSGLIVGGVMLGLVVLSSNDSPSKPETANINPAPVSAITLATRGRQQRTTQLKDGTTVWLGRNTQLRIDRSTAIREIHLDHGAVGFDVASDPARRFVVHSGSVATEAISGEFVIDRRRAERVEVAVLSGSVRVSFKDGGPTMLSAAEVIVAEAGELGAVQRRSLAEIGRWREGFVVFESRPVLDALESLEPYSNFVLDTLQIQDHPGVVSGTFFTDRADEGIASILTDHEITFTHSGRVLVLHPSAQQRPTRR